MKWNPGDRKQFLKKGGVFTDDVIDAYIDLKMQDVTRFRMSTHPVELDIYYGMKPGCTGHNTSWTVISRLTEWPWRVG